MFKHVVSALAISTILVSGAAFAADQTAAPAAPASQTAAAAVTAPAPTGKAHSAVKKVSHKVEHKRAMKAEAKTSPAPATTAAAPKTN